jgi:HEAT repeat protein
VATGGTTQAGDGRRGRTPPDETPLAVSTSGTGDGRPGRTPPDETPLAASTSGDDGPIDRAARLVALGLDEDAAPFAVDSVASVALRDSDARVRAAALAALARAGTADAARAAWEHALGDPDVVVRRRVGEVAPVLAVRTEATVLVAGLVELLRDADGTVVEPAAWALGELGDAAISAGATRPLATTATAHDDPLAREAAVAALGALGDPAGLDAVLVACHDKPAIRRRAVLALAPFEGAAVEAAIDAALEDRDWQVRQAAEDLKNAAGNG